MVAIVSVPVDGLWMEIFLLQSGLLFGLARSRGAIMRVDNATMASLSELVSPHEPVEELRSALLAIEEHSVEAIENIGMRGVDAGFLYTTYLNRGCNE